MMNRPLDEQQSCHQEDGISLIRTQVPLDVDKLTSRDIGAESGGDNALGMFMGRLMKMRESSMPSPAPKEESSSLPTSFCIIEDGAKGLERSCSLSFRRVVREQRHRRRTHAIDSKRISRWESYPCSHKDGNQRREAKPKRRLSPPLASRASENDRGYRTREAIHQVLQDVEQVLEGSSFSNQSFTPCCTWLDVVSKHDSYSPKPSPRVGLSLTGAARVPQKNSAEEALLLAAQAKSGKAAKRAAALKRSCPPRRPQRQASLTNVKMAFPSLDESTGEATDPACSSSSSSSSEGQRPRRHSDTSHAHPAHGEHHGHRRHAVRHSIPSIAREGALSSKMASQEDACQEYDDAPEKEYSDTSSKEHYGFCARSA